MGLGNLGGGAQMLFGGSGGQDIFQKITWILGALFMAGSLSLAIIKSRQTKSIPAYSRQQLPISAPANPAPSSTDDY